MARTLSRFRTVILAAVDMGIIFLSYIASSFICRLKLFEIKTIYSLIILFISYSIMLSAFKSYKSLWRYAQPTEYLVCLFANLAGGFLFMTANERLVRTESQPIYFYFLIVTISIVGTIGLRASYRFLRRKRVVGKGFTGKRTLLVGAGAAALSLIVYSKESTHAEYVPVAAVDDDPEKLGRELYGVKVYGTTDDISEICRKYEIDAIVLAIPAASYKRRSEIVEKCMDTGCIVKTLPDVSLLSGISASQLARQIREIMPEELLGREPVDVSNDKISEVVRNRIVLVTGGGGSIGSELCRQIAAHEPKMLIIVDIYENNAYEIEQELKRKYKNSLDLIILIASVRDFERMQWIFKTYNPEIVFHAAAHKHVPLMESSPKEAVKNNIFGTLNVARAAIEVKAEKFILISTDKAVNPTNIMGATKRVCEMIVQAYNGCSDTAFLSVRFGNVLGSNGSVIPLFKKQIAYGGPVTVTHPDIIRYFMTISEASQLVLITAALAKGGEIFILDMGEPIKIDDLARKMIKLAGFIPGKDIEIEYTGLRPGEKLYEEFLLEDENATKTENDKIYVGHQPPIDEEVLREKVKILKEIAFDESTSSEDVEIQLRNIVDTFHRNGNDSKCLQNEIY